MQGKVTAFRRKSVANNTINIVSVGQLFPRVIYAAPVLNEYMMKLSISIYNEFATIPETNISKFINHIRGCRILHLANVLIRSR